MPLFYAESISNRVNLSDNREIDIKVPESQKENKQLPDNEWVSLFYSPLFEDIKKTYQYPSSKESEAIFRVRSLFVSYSLREGQRNLTENQMLQIVKTKLKTSKDDLEQFLSHVDRIKRINNSLIEYYNNLCEKIGAPNGDPLKEDSPIVRQAVCLLLYMALMTPPSSFFEEQEEKYDQNIAGKVPSLFKHLYRTLDQDPDAGVRYQACLVLQLAIEHEQLRKDFDSIVKPYIEGIKKTLEKETDEEVKKLVIDILRIVLKKQQEKTFKDFERRLPSNHPIFSLLGELQKVDNSEVPFMMNFDQEFKESYDKFKRFCRQHQSSTDYFWRQALDEFDKSPLHQVLEDRCHLYDIEQLLLHQVLEDRRHLYEQLLQGSLYQREIAENNTNEMIARRDPRKHDDLATGPYPESKYYHPSKQQGPPGIYENKRTPVLKKTC